MDKFDWGYLKMGIANCAGGDMLCQLLSVDKSFRSVIGEKIMRCTGMIVGTLTSYK